MTEEKRDFASLPWLWGKPILPGIMKMNF